MDLRIQQTVMAAIPLPIDQIRLLFGLFLCFPLSLVLNRLASPTQRLWFSTVTASLVQYSVLGFQAYYLWIQVAIVYLIIKLCNRRHVGRYVTFQSFAYLSVIHLKRFIEDSGLEVDVTAILMMSTCKFIMFAFCYQDGAKGMEESSVAEREKFKIQALPSCGEYLGFIQFLPSCLVGPAFEFTDYSDYLHRRNDFSHRISTVRPALEEMARSLICSGVYVLLGTFFKGVYLVSEEYSKSTLLFQFGYVMLLVLGVRMKYYAVWFLSMVGVKASGLSYQRLNGRSQTNESFDRIEVARIWDVEFGDSFKLKVDSWNMSVQQFLKRYVYERLYVESDPNDKNRNSQALKQKAQSATIILSAFWHGFYPSYITSFFHWMLVLQVNQQVHRILRERRTAGESEDKRTTGFNLARLLSSSFVAKAVTVLVLNFYLNYYGAFFILFRMSKIMTFSQASLNVPSFALYTAYYLLVMKKWGFPSPRGTPKLNPKIL